MSHTAELIAVGTEILLGNIANTDAQMLSEELAALSVNVLYHTVVGDNPTRLAEALELARRRVDIVITTGGLGPTYDDLTKQTICTVFGRKNVFHPEIADALRTHFASIGRELTENNLQQAYLPENCTIFRNHNGTAPGCGFCEGGVHVLMLPGPPHECRKMFRTGAIPYLRALSDEIIVSHSLRIYGQGESQIEAMLHDRIASMVNPSVAPYAKPDECMLRVTAKAKSEAEAEEMLRGAIEEVMPVIGEWVYGIDVGSLEEVVSALLREKGQTLAAAESCTGGLIAKRMTDLPGASQVFMGGVVSYTNFVKANVLGVPQALLDEHGAVSEPVARAMAEGVRAVTGADYGISVTGVAGPDSDERGNAVGTVYIGLAGPDGTLCRGCFFELIAESAEVFENELRIIRFPAPRGVLDGFPSDLFEREGSPVSETEAAEKIAVDFGIPDHEGIAVERSAERQVFDLYQDFHFRIRHQMNSQYDLNKR